MKSNLGSIRRSGALASALILGLAGCTSLPVSPTTVISSSPMMSEFRARVDFQPPVAKTTVAPEFPPDLRRLGVTGMVRIDCLIDTAGQVHDPKVVESSLEDLEAPALAAVIRWTFEPGRRDGVPVPTRVTIPIRFAVNP